MAGLLLILVFVDTLLTGYLIARVRRFDRRVRDLRAAVVVGAPSRSSVDFEDEV